MDDSSTAGRERRCAAAINAVLGTKPGEPLGDSAVADLAALCRLSEVTLRTAVLDRRLAGDSWPEISTQLGTSPQAARKRFTAPSHPDEPAELVEFPDAAAYYTARPALAEAWGFTGDHRPEPGTAPFGSDEGSLRTAAGNWMLTLVAPPGALRFDLWRRVGAPQAAHPATSWPPTAKVSSFCSLATCPWRPRRAHSVPCQERRAFKQRLTPSTARHRGPT